MSVTLLLVMVIAYSIVSLHAQPVTWLAFDDQVEPVPAKWVAESNGGTMYLLEADPGAGQARMQWHAGTPTDVLYCTSAPQPMEDGRFDCAGPQSPAETTPRASPSVTP
jgi:hypothetical protein